jgi:hypothetical protein
VAGQAVPLAQQQGAAAAGAAALPEPPCNAQNRTLNPNNCDTGSIACGITLQNPTGIQTRLPCVAVQASGGTAAALFLLYVIVTFEAGTARQSQDERGDEFEEESVQELVAVDSVSMHTLHRAFLASANEDVVVAAAVASAYHQ